MNKKDTTFVHTIVFVQKTGSSHRRDIGYRHNDIHCKILSRFLPRIPTAPYHFRDMPCHMNLGIVASEVIGIRMKNI